jgi:hypothetical protein
LAFGNISATTNGLGGFPSTPTPPGAIVDGLLDAMDHRFTINRGILLSAGERTDFATEPLEAAGTGIGFATLTEFPPLAANTRRFEIRIDLPVAAQQVLTIENVPLIGTTDVDVDILGQIVSRKQFDLEIPNGDFNLDGVSDCDDLALLYDRVDLESDYSTFDVDGDGTVTLADGQAWVAALGFSSGDANLDGEVNETDWGHWNANRFTAVSDWCRGDFNADGAVDGADFNQWNDHRTVAPLAVPESGGWATWLIYFGSAAVAWRASSTSARSPKNTAMRPKPLGKNKAAV